MGAEIDTSRLSKFNKKGGSSGAKLKDQSCAVRGGATSHTLAATGMYLWCLLFCSFRTQESEFCHLVNFSVCRCLQAHWVCGICGVITKFTTAKYTLFLTRRFSLHTFYQNKLLSTKFFYSSFTRI